MRSFFIIFIFFVFEGVAIASESYASQDLKFWLEWDLQCYESSMQLRAEKPKPASTFCATYRKRNPADTERSIDFLMSDRHVPAILANAFHATRLDHREAALLILQSYPCRDAVWCRDTLNRLEAEIGKVRSRWAVTHPELLKSAQKIAARISVDLGKRPKAKPASGLCRDSDSAAYWLGITFTGHCPLKDAEKLPKSLVIDRQAFVFDLESQSQQIVISSSRVQSVEFDEPCGKPWQVAIACESSSLMRFTFECAVADSGLKHWGEALPVVTCSQKK